MFIEKIMLPGFLLCLLAWPLSAWGAADLPQGWDHNPYGAWISGKWDSAVLPACVPKELPGVKVDQTTYKAKSDKTMNDRNEVGWMNFADSNFEKWGLHFDCQQEQADAFLKAVGENGFFGGQIEENSSFAAYAWIGNGYYAYAQVRANLSSGKDSGVDRIVSFQITPIVHKLPKSFNGWPLPQAGAALESYDGWSLMYWDDKGDDHEVKWDLRADKGTLPAKQWLAGFAYFGLSDAEAAAYAETLAAAGWQITYENKASGEDQYSCQLKKGDVWARIFFDRRFVMEVCFSDVPEMLER